MLPIGRTDREVEGLAIPGAMQFSIRITDNVRSAQEAAGAWIDALPRSFARPQVSVINIIHPKFARVQFKIDGV